jgi:hypothetical protein
MNYESGIENTKNEKNGLSGQPGYRTRENRSGLDPIDSSLEISHQEGTFLRNLLTLKLRSHDPFHLVVMALFGVFFLVFSSVFLYATIVDWESGNAAWIMLLCILVPFFLISIFLIINLVLSIISKRSVMSGQIDQSTDNRTNTDVG